MMSASEKRPAVFLDRDGVLVRLVPYLSRVHQLELYPGVAPALATLERAGFALVVVTNQSALARGLLTWPELQRIHRKLREMLHAGGVVLDGIYVCPHHPRWHGPCPCRKPEPGLLLQAADDLGLDLASSYLVGDRLDDVEAAARAGATGILVKTGYGTEEARKPLAVTIPIRDDLPAAAEWILNAQRSR
ncbi:MAG: HAD-IIIA family hydrolase [Candidatus Eisenbacteria bacterium]|nr:HAD-IIIA family hydrolase [Candidatus Eisenbacteria bacterium]